MTDANEMYDTIIRELENLNCDANETKKEQESFSFHEEADADYIPPSLLSYFETSKNRAAVCEKLLLEDPEDFTASHHTENMMNLPIELHKDMMKVNEQVICDTENEENNSSIDILLLPAPTETEAVFTDSVSVCPNNEDEAGTHKYMAFEMRTLEISLNKEERNGSSAFKAEQEKQHCEEMKREERKRQIERDFQKELRDIIEAEKLHQEELELKEKRAQEKLEQEFLLQQELINNLQKRVEKERRIWEEEQKRVKDEEDKRKKEEEKNKVEAKRKRVEEETRRKKEEERKAEEAKIEEEKKRRMEEEEKSKREEERHKIDLEKKKLEDEMRMMREEEERKRKEEVERTKGEEEKRKREEERKKIEEAKVKMEKEKKKMEEEMSRKMEEEERKKRERENMSIEEMGRVTKKIEERKKPKEEEEEEADERNEITRDRIGKMRERDKRAHGNVDEEIELEERKKEEEGGRKKREEENEEARKREKERKKMKEKDVKEVIRKQEEDNRKMKEELRPDEEDEKRKREDGRKIIEEEWRRRQNEETRRQRDEEDHRKSEEERHKEDKGGSKVYDVDYRKMEHESKTKDKEKRKEERHKIALENKLEDEMRMMKEEEKRTMKEEVERIKEEEEEKKKSERERKKTEEARNKMEKEKRKIETEMSRKMEEELRKMDEDERKKSEKENMSIEEMGRVMKKTEERKKQEELRKEREEEEEADERKKTTQEKTYKEMRERNKRAHGNVNEEIELEQRKKKEEANRKEEEENEEAKKREKERKKMEEKDVKEVVRKQEEDNRKMKAELRPVEEDEKRKKEDGRKMKEEEWRRRQNEEMRKQRDEGDHKKSEEERHKEDKGGSKVYDVDFRKMEHESKTKDKEKKQTEEAKGQREEERQNVEAEKEQSENKKEINKKEEELRLKENVESKNRMVQDGEKEVSNVRANEVQEERETRESNSMTGQKEKNNVSKTENSSQPGDSTTRISTKPVASHGESAICPTSAEATLQQRHLDENVSTEKTVDSTNQAARPSTASVFSAECLPEHTEQKRLSWMKECIPWSKLSLQNRRKQNGSVWSRRGLRRPAEAGSLPPLCPDSLLQSTGWKSLQEVTTVALEDLPGCSLSTLAHCTQLQSLSLRRCGLKSLEGINQLPQLCYVDVQENDISFVDCENMTSLQVLRLGHNKLTSIHGLTGAQNLAVLNLSHNSITRIAGLESVRRLQRLSVDHNQLISTKGLRDVYTLLHLNCSHNHLARVEGLENSALLHTLDLRANSLTEPPTLNNQVLLRELYLDDNSISSLQGLSACWLPLMQHLSVAQNRITQLPSMSDSLSLANLDLRFNCLSELQNMCESLEGCQSLRELHLTGNPLQQESGWRSTLQRAVPGLRAMDNQETESSLSPPAVRQASVASGSFLKFCQAQLQQTRDLQQQHSRELSKASSSLDALKTSCRHFTEALQLATDQRFAHEYGDTTVADKHRAEGTRDMDSTTAQKCTESTGKVSPLFPDRGNIRSSYWTFEENSAAESWHDTFDSFPAGPMRGLTASKAHTASVLYLETERKTISSNPQMAPVSNHQNLDLHNTAATVIQQLWRKYRQKCGNISSPSTAEKGEGRGGDGGKPESGPSYINGSTFGQEYAATIIQAFWRGFTLRKRLASALAAVTCPDIGEDDTFEEVDVDEFVFDEAELEKHWLVSLPEDLAPRRYPVLEQPLSAKPPGPCPEPSRYITPPPLVRRSKQAWVAGEPADSAGQTVSSVSSGRSKSPASASAVSGLSERSEKILEEWGFTNRQTALLMLKRAQNMKSKKQQQKKRRDPSVRLPLFKTRSYQLGPAGARNRQAPHSRSDIKVQEAELRLQQEKKTERVKHERAQQWLHTQAAHSDRDSESVPFLPEISSDVLNGGRVQLVADPGYTERLHHASGLWANSSLAAQPCKENNYPRRNSLGYAREKVPTPEPVTSAPSMKERISFRDNPVQLSGGWGGGKKRDKVYK